MGCAGPRRPRRRARRLRAGHGRRRRRGPHDLPRQAPDGHHWRFRRAFNLYANAQSCMDSDWRNDLRLLSGEVEAFVRFRTGAGWYNPRALHMTQNTIRKISAHMHDFIRYNPRALHIVRRGADGAPPPPRLLSTNRCGQAKQTNASIGHL